MEGKKEASIMKLKIIALSLCVTMVLYGLCGCGNGDKNDNEIKKLEQRISDLQNEIESYEQKISDISGGQSELIESQDVESVKSVEYDPNDYFSVATFNRQKARDESQKMLQSIVDTPKIDEKVKNDTLAAITKLASEIECEANIETIIIAKGFEKCVALINGDNANIILKTEGLMPSEVAIIKEVVYEQAGILPSNTEIIEKN